MLVGIWYGNVFAVLWPRIHSASGASSDGLAAVSTAPAEAFRAPLTARYGRMFSLPAWEPPGATHEARIEHVWQLASSFGEAVAENPDIPAGYTYFGQLVAHDLSHDASKPAVDLGLEAAQNLRTPRLDLDCVYGAGPIDQPYLFAVPRPGHAGADRLLLGRNENFELDLPRNADDGTDEASTCTLQNRRRVALIGDPRNDENILVSQLHLQILRLHNRLVEEGRGLEEARRLTAWHYQWIVVQDFLRRLCGDDAVDGRIRDLGDGQDANACRFYRDRSRLPIEFALAGFRVGHSMIRPSYHLSDALERDRGGFPTAIFALDPPHGLQGGRELPPNWTIQWDRFVDWRGREAQRSMAIDTSLAAPLREIPNPWPSDVRLRSLAFRTLLRGWAYRLPSGQAVARAIGADPEIEGDDPLWLYVLREAESLHDGRRLGPVGATIVSEVVLGTLHDDPRSFLCQEPGWTPLDEMGGSQCGLAHVLAYAGAPMSVDDWYAERERADVARHAHLERLRHRDHERCLKPAPPR